MEVRFRLSTCADVELTVASATIINEGIRIHLDEYVRVNIYGRVEVGHRLCVHQELMNVIQPTCTKTNLHEPQIFPRCANGGFICRN